jgi:PAS domain S-box-containing protein
MELTSNNKPLSIFGIALSILSTSIMMGWWFNVGFITEPVDSIKINTAFCFLLVGVIISINHESKFSKYLEFTASIIVFGIAFLSIIENFSSVNIGINRLLLFNSKSDFHLMSGATSFCFMAIAGGLFFLLTKLKNRYHISGILFQLAGFTAFTSLISHLFSLSLHMRPDFLATMSVITSLLFLSISITYIFLYKQVTGFLLKEDSLRSVIIKSFLIFITVTILIGYSFFELVKFQMLSNEMSYVLLLSTIIVFSISFIFYLISRVRQVDIERALTEDTLKSSNTNLISYLERANKEIQFKNSEFNAIFTALEESSLVSITDKNGVILSINDRFCKVAKYSKSELIGKNHRIINSGYHDKSFWSDMWATLSKDQIWRAEVKNRAKDGSYYWVDTVVSPIMNDAGETYQFISIRQDITSKKNNEEELELKTNRLNSAQQIAKIGGWELDLKTGITAWTQEVYTIHEVALDFDHNKANGIEFYHPDYRQVITKAIEDAISGGVSFDVECRFITAKNNHKWVRVFGKPILENDEVVKLFGVFQDITERKEQEQALELSDKRVSLATKAAGVGIWEYDVENNALFWDHQMFSLYNLDNSQVKNTMKLWQKSLHKEDRERVAKEMEMAISGEKDFDTEFRVIIADGSIKHIRALAFVSRDAEANSVKVIGTNWDVTDLKNYESKLKEAKIEADNANKAKSEFLANMSHEIRTPLNGVIGFTHLALGTQLDEVQKEYLETVNISANSLLDVINDILDFSKIEAGKMDLNETKIDIHEMVSKIGNIIRHQLKNKDIELLLNILPNEIPQYIWADETRLRQVVINLLSNALKFTEKGEIELKIESIDEHNPNKLRFSVSDTGIGIEKDNCERIFQAFKQADSSTMKRFGGTGLGLSISNKLLGLMNSHLQLESEFGKGSIFYFDVELQTEKGDIHIDQNAGNKFNNVLLIDDNKTNLRILSNVLAAYNINTIELYNGQDAIEYLSNNQKVDLIIIDFHMPGCNGIETIEAMKAKNLLDTNQTPVILFHSVDSQDNLAKQVANSGIRYQLSKPLDLKKLNHCLNSIVGDKKYTEVEEIISKINNHQSFEGIKLLLVEDNPINMKLAKIMINNILPEVELHCAENGAEAIELFKIKGADIIITDIQMPVMNGYQLTKEIKKITPDKSIPIIALTAGTVKGEREKCLNLGMNECLSKPIVENTLREAIGHWLPVKKVAENGEQIDKTRFDKEMLFSVVKDNQLVTELLAMVKIDIEINLSNIKKAFKDNDLSEMKNLAHRLKGTALSVHMSKLRKHAHHLEHITTTDRDEIEHTISQLDQEIDFLKQHAIH